jgi:hypothetical protein
VLKEEEEEEGFVIKSTAMKSRTIQPQHYNMALHVKDKYKAVLDIMGTGN